MLSAKLSPHLMPVVFVMTTARLTRNLCVHLTRQHSRTSASVCWTFANAKVITPSTIQAAVQVRLPGYQERVNCLCRSKNVQALKVGPCSTAFANKKYVAAIGTERSILCPFAEPSRARNMCSGTPWVTKFGHPFWHVRKFGNHLTIRPSTCPSTPASVCTTGKPV